MDAGGYEENLSKHILDFLLEGQWCRPAYKALLEKWIWQGRTSRWLLIKMNAIYGESSKSIMSANSAVGLVL
jgi:hypothetical protein